MWNLNKCRDSQNFQFNGYQKIKSSCTESAVLLSCASYTTVYDAALHNVTVPTWWMALTHPTRTLNKCHANTRYSTLSYIFTTMMSRYAIHHSSETVNLYVHASLKQHKWLKCFLVQLPMYSLRDGAEQQPASCYGCQSISIPRTRALR